MSRPRILIEEATAQQLRDFASIGLGLEIGGRETCQMMKGKLIEAGYTADSFVDLSHTPDSSSEPVREKHENPSYRINADGVPEHRIIIPESEKAGGSEPVQVGVNGRVILIGRGIPSWVPEPYVEVLRNATEFVYDEFKGESSGNGVDLGGLKKPRSVMSYPFNQV